MLKWFTVLAPCWVYLQCPYDIVIANTIFFTGYNSLFLALSVLYYIYILKQQSHRAPFFLIFFFFISFTTHHSPIIGECLYLFNPGLLNKLYYHHPQCVFYVLVLSLLYKRIFYQYIVMALMVYCICLGMWWAKQEVLWGGLWNWDLVESALFYILVFLTLSTHNSYFKNSLMSLRLLLYIIFLYYLIVNRSPLSLSIHSFTNNFFSSLTGTTLLICFLFLLFSIITMFSHFKCLGHVCLFCTIYLKYVALLLFWGTNYLDLLNKYSYLFVLVCLILRRFNSLKLFFLVIIPITYQYFFYVGGFLLFLQKDSKKTSNHWLCLHLLFCGILIILGELVVVIYKIQLITPIKNGYDQISLFGYRQSLNLQIYNNDGGILNTNAHYSAQFIIKMHWFFSNKFLQQVYTYKNFFTNYG